MENDSERAVSASRDYCPTTPAAGRDPMIGPGEAVHFVPNGYRSGSNEVPPLPPFRGTEPMFSAGTDERRGGAVSGIEQTKSARPSRDSLWNRIEKAAAGAEDQKARAEAAARLSNIARHNPQLIQAIDDLMTLGLLPRW